MQKPTCILLCAGKGTRMKDERTHKVCYEIAGVPAIIRLIDHLRQAGIAKFVVVVGNRAEKVMQCLANIPGVVFAYQAEQTGTGSAALCGLQTLKAMGIEGPTLIAMGDKIIAPDVVERLIKTYEENSVGCVFATQPQAFNREGGRVVIRDGRVYGIVEKLDICLRRLAERKPRNEEELRKEIQGMDLSEKKQEQLFQVARQKMDALDPTLSLGGRRFTPDQAESSGVINTATYLMDSVLAYQALLKVDGNNAQGEIYLTDAVNTIAAHQGAMTVQVEQPEKLLTYSTMEDLLRLEQYFSQSAIAEKRLDKASEWLQKLNVWDAELRKKFIEIYGDDEQLLQERRTAYTAVLQAYLRKYGDQEVVIARAPGRVNLMGRHIEHRGGSINVMSINREMLAVAGIRSDDSVCIGNTDAKFEERRFSILESIRGYDTSNWVDFIESDEITQMVLDTKGDWSNYVKAGVLRLQLNDPKQMLHGMNMMFHGNIPMAAGLSSSSSIVVATMEAAVSLNNTELQAKEFIHLCGEGEWFVGSRGGAGDHAAMKSGKKNQLTHISFCPFEIQDSVPFPQEYSLVIVNSYVDAKKSAGAKDQFNQRVASYEFGFMLLREKFPQYHAKMKFLKNINPDTLQVPPSKIYEMLLALPEKITVAELIDTLPESYHGAIQRILKTHKQPESYEIRSVILYGIAECERAEKCMDLLKQKDYRMLGKLMNISHDGDRVCRDGKPFDYRVSDVHLYHLINMLKSEDPQKVLEAQLWMQPGGYACSTPVIDELVDMINRQEGVMGSQLSGAGLGGCIMVFIEREYAQPLIQRLDREYYQKHNYPLGAQIFTPVSGSMTLEQAN